MPDTYSAPKSGKCAFVALVKLDTRHCVACEACFFENLRIKRYRFHPPQNAKALQPLRIFPTSYGSWKTKGNDAGLQNRAYTLSNLADIKRYISIQTSTIL